MNLVERFLKYVSFDTQSDELTRLTPSTPGANADNKIKGRNIRLEKSVLKNNTGKTALSFNAFFLNTS